jgi:hypothetical protein
MEEKRLGLLIRLLCGSDEMDSTYRRHHSILVEVALLCRHARS